MTPRTAQPATVGRVPALPGRPFPLGATVRDGGTNFAVEAAAADNMLVCLFDESGAESQIRCWITTRVIELVPVNCMITRGPSLRCSPASSRAALPG
jgi:hypothetical protein